MEDKYVFDWENKYFLDESVSSIKAIFKKQTIIMVNLISYKKDELRDIRNDIKDWIKKKS